MPPRCLVCGGRGGGPAFPNAQSWIGRRFDYLNCSACGCVFIDPVPSTAEMDSLFDPARYHDLYYPDPTPTSEDEALVVRIRGLVGEGGTMLDFGCGNGRLLRAARGIGLAAEGVERTEAVATLAESNSGCRVRTTERLAGDAPVYGLIHLSDVLGHLADPAEAMRALERHLAPGGLFLVEGPLERQHSLVFYSAALSSFVRSRLLGGRAPDSPPHHLAIHSLQSQLHFFEAVLGYDCVDLEVWETGWPYSAAVGAGAAAAFKRLVARFARRLSKTWMGRRIPLGNRFRALLRPAPQRVAGEAPNR